MGFLKALSRRSWVLPQTSLIAFVVLVCVLLIGLDGVRIWDQRLQRIEIGQRQAANLAIALEQHTEDTIRAADGALIGLVESIERDGTNDGALRSMQLFRAQVEVLPELDGFSAFDAAGNLMAATEASPPKINIADREHFKYWQTHDDNKNLYIAAPVKSRINGAWMVPLTRRINRADGSMAGIVVARLSMIGFQNLYDRFDVGEDGAISLIRSDGTLLVRHPFIEQNIGRNLSGGQIFQDLLPRVSAGTEEIKSVADGVVRITSYRRVDKYPLVIVVGLAKEDVLAPWRASTGIRLIGTVGMTAMIGLLGFAVVTQVRKRRLIEQTHQETAAAYRLLADNTSDVIMRIGPDGKRVYVSPACRDLTGYTPEELISHPVGELVHPADRGAWAGVDSGSARLAKNQVAQATYRIIRKDGSHVWVEANRQQLPGGLGYIVAIRDISGRKRMQDQVEDANRQLEHLARQDALTGLANRRYFDEMIAIELQRAARDETTLSLIMIDIDHFKGFNDRYGHPAGDECLKAVAQAMREAPNRPGDVVARYGGEEFAILLPNTPETGALIIAERIRHAVRLLRIEHDASRHKIVTISLGVASLVPQRQVHRPKDLIGAADRALYEAKGAGRDRVYSAAELVAAEIPATEAARRVR
jgi:diguanylate cyclase (GGDEF)-like protein/PAS domain S-box-containing protein